MILPHLSHNKKFLILHQNDCTPPKGGELTEYTDSAHTEVEYHLSRRVVCIFVKILLKQKCVVA